MTPHAWLTVSSFLGAGLGVGLLAAMYIWARRHPPTARRDPSDSSAVYKVEPGWADRYGRPLDGVTWRDISFDRIFGGLTPDQPRIDCARSFASFRAANLWSSTAGMVALRHGYRVTAREVATDGRPPFDIVARLTIEKP